MRRGLSRIDVKESTRLEFTPIGRLGGFAVSQKIADILLPACILALSLAIAAPAQAQKQVTLNSFKGSNVWPVWAAQKQGFFDQQGLVIKNVYTANSVAQMVGLIKGEFDMVTTALDNVIAYAEGEGSPEAPKDADLVAILGGNNGALSLIARPDIKAVRDLKGRDLAVDAIATGFSFVLRDILARNGIGANDYKLVPFGNTGARLAALREGKAAAGLLTPPFSQTAIAQGYSNLADAADVLGGYQGSISATRRDWAKANADVVVGYIRGYRAGLEWLLAPANRQAAIDVLRAEIPEITEAAAGANYALMVTNPRGFDIGGKIDLAGSRQVLDLRRRWGPAGKSGTDIGRFLDESYFERALR
jgi:ABC-type nitrate/sulfonate/bicarbonate transport system substrate-binding protein